MDHKAAPDVSPSRSTGECMPVVPVAKISPGYAFAKRALDVLISAAVLVLGLPVWLLIGCLIKITSRGPVIYRQTRIGMGGLPFVFYKFRSMRDGADAERHTVEHLNTTGGPTFKAEDDPRITPLGKILRRTSLDEIPQLWIVLTGQMSLVGPRPPLPEEVECYRDDQMARLGVPQGLTCLWQINGRSDISFEEQVRLDLDYIARRSIWLDLYILIRTVPVVLFGTGAR